MAAPGFLVVGEHVARNPIARAIARQRMHAAARDFAIQVHLLPDGADVRAELSAAARVLAVAVRVTERRCRTPEDRDTPALRVMAGGMGAVAQCSERRWRWRALDTVAVDRALQEALAVLRDAHPQETREAWLYVESLKPTPDPSHEPQAINQGATAP
jgi:hypothetical protein